MNGNEFLARIQLVLMGKDQAVAGLQQVQKTAEDMGKVKSLFLG
jgi:hypothetical protein